VQLVIFTWCLNFICVFFEFCKRTGMSTYCSNCYIIASEFEVCSLIGASVVWWASTFFCVTSRISRKSLQQNCCVVPNWQFENDIECCLFLPFVIGKVNLVTFADESPAVNRFCFALKYMLHLHTCLQSGGYCWAHTETKGHARLVQLLEWWWDYLHTYQYYQGWQAVFNSIV